jgi:hypothetical protein
MMRDLETFTIIWIFVSIILGVIGKYLFDTWSHNSPWSWKDLGKTAVIALILSILLFSVVLGLIDKNTSTLFIFITGFTNGFAWESVVLDGNRRIQVSRQKKLNKASTTPNP